jgi:protein MAK11
MLNLVHDRSSFACRLQHPASNITYAQDTSGGDRFMVATEEKVAVHDSMDAKIIHEMDCGKRVLTFMPTKVEALPSCSD